MTATTELGEALAAIRSNGGLLIQRNCLQPEVVESWLQAVERELDREPADWTALRICFEVIDRWISSVPELWTARQVLARSLARGGAAGSDSLAASSFEKWYWQGTSSERP